MLGAGEAIDRINAVFGRHPHTRALHAKGSFYAGTFTATPEAAQRCIAGHLQGAPVPILVRWSNGGGNPNVPDKAPDVRGMAISFTLPDGSSTDLLGQTAPRFPVRTPEDFVAFTEAAKKPLLLPVFLLRHRDAVPALVASARAKALAKPVSFAAATYYPVHAYGWIGPDGTRRWVRYVLKPRGFDHLDMQFAGPDALTEEIRAQLHVGVVTFDPTRVVEGIELSDDPILHYRALAYTESAKRRA